MGACYNILRFTIGQISQSGGISCRRMHLKIDGFPYRSPAVISESKRHTIMRRIEQRNMPASKVGKSWRFKTVDLDDWVRNGCSSDDQGAVE